LKPTVYTFTNLINACVRCGEIARAKRYVEEMVALKVFPNEASIYQCCFLTFVGDIHSPDKGFMPKWWYPRVVPVGGRNATTKNLPQLENIQHDT
jgi:pentatricopeptide repeat protein